MTDESRIAQSALAETPEAVGGDGSYWDAGDDAVR